MSAEAVPAPRHFVRPAYRELPYLRYVGGQAVSTLGDQVWYVALSWAAVRLASPSLAGLVLAVSALPRLALLLFGGVLADRYQPRLLMIGSDVLRAMVSLGVAAVALAHPGIPLLVLAAVVFGLADAVFLPAAGAVAPRLLHSDQLTAGAAINAMLSRVALTIGAPLGGVLVAVGGLPLACTVNAATFVVSVAALASVQPRPVAARDSSLVPERFGGALRAGLAHLVRHPLLRVLLLISLLTNLGFVGPMNIGLALVSERRGWGAGGIGDMLAGFGLGAVAGALMVTPVRAKARPKVTVATCAAGQGVAVFAIAVAPWLSTAVLATACAGLTSGPLAIVIGSMAQRFTRDEFRGRVSSVTTLVNLGVTPLAMAAMGALSGCFGVVPTFAVSAILEVFAALVCLVWLSIPDAPDEPAGLGMSDAA